jgi:hypothetical protein
MKRFKNFINEDHVYRGIGEKINTTYGSGSDVGMGIFWTDNKTMAEWFAGNVDYDVDTEQYEIISKNGKVIEKEINFKKPYIIDETNPEYDLDDGYDSFQIYMKEIEEIGGVEEYKNNLLNKGYDGIFLKGCTTNYYNDGIYNIYVEI